METLEQRDVDPSVLEVKSHYSLRSGYRRVPGVSRNRRAVRPVGFISQSRDRYSDADDDGDGSSTIISDRETDGEDSDFSRNEDVESNGDSSDGDYDRQRRIAGPNLSEFVNEIEIPDLNLPDSSMDLMIDIENVQQTVGVYQVLRQFSRILCLSPFRFEDFCMALIVNEQSSLLVEAHISLLKCILQEEDNNNSMFGPHDARDSINISLFLVDSLTWFEVLRIYFDSLTCTEEIQRILPFFSYRHYQDLNTSQRLLLLQTLSDLFLTTNLVREAIMKEGAFIHEEQCRLCHRRGDLICCETCPAVFHLECLNPPLKSVPDGDWYCSVCSALQVKGINECTSDRRISLLCRLEPLGFDRNHRKYWLLCRRIFVEGNHRTWYYSSSAQLEQLLLCLDGEKWESELVSVLRDMKSAIVSQMAVTEELTNKARGKRKAALASHDEFLLEQRSKLSVKVESEKSQKSVEEMAGNEKVNSDEMSLLPASTTMDPSESSDFKGKTEVDCVTHTQMTSCSADRDTNVCRSDVNENVRNGSNQVESKEEIGENDSAVCVEEAVKEHYDGNSDDVHSALIADTLHDDKITSTVKDSSASLLAPDMRQTRSMSRHITNFPELESESMTDALKTTTSLFKLGMEGNYKNYVNLYSTNAVALSKQQQNDERDRRRHLSYKFSLTPRSDFSWNAVVYGLMRQTIDAVRKGLLGLEANIDRCYLHPNWGQNSGRWQRAVGFCSSALEFGLALMIFETCMKPLLFNNVWHESLGHVQLHRTTASEREERKKKEKDWKRLRNEDDFSSGTTVKYSLGLHHQVWKQKGEEYRSTGKGGWFWISFTRSSCRRPLMKRSRFFRDNCTSNHISLDSVNEENAIKTESVTGSGSGRRITETESVVDANLSDEFTRDQESCLKHLERNTVKNADKFCNFFDISDALVSRSAYHKRPLIKCFLDELLEKRKRHLELELKQKVSLELALKKFETEFALINHVTPHCTSSEGRSESEVDARALKLNSCSSYTAKLKFSNQLSDCLDEPQETEEQEDESDHEVILEKEDRDDNSSVESMVGDADDITMSEDSNLSNASSFANVVPPPIRSAAVGKPPVKQTFCDLITNAEETSNGLQSEVRRSDVNSLNAKSQIEFNFACNVIYPLEAYIKEGNVLLTRPTAKEIREKLSEIGRTEFPVKLSRLSGKKRRMHFRKGGIPVAHNFQTRGNKRSIFVIEKDQLITLARKGGQTEVAGFSYNCKMSDVDWPYPGPRPYFKTAWRYRTLTAASLSAIALQLRILWANIRWDDMATKYPVGKSNTMVTDDYVTTVELLKRRDIGPTNLRAEYLVQKTVSPLEAPAANRERSLPPQRSGLRERRQPEASILKRPVTSELWMPEEQLELWEVRLFADRLEKKEHKQRERCSEKKSKALPTTLVKLQEPTAAGQNAKVHLQKNTETKHLETPPLKTVSAAVEEELQKQRLQMQQKRIGLLLRGQQQLNHQPPVIRTNERTASGTCRPESAQNVIPGSLKLVGRRLITSKVSKHERSFSVSSVSSNRFTRPPSSPVKSFCQNPSASNMATSPPSPAPSRSPLPQPSTIQSIRIKKGADGQLQVTGLQPGQEIIHLADGRLRLITKPPSSSPPLSHQQPSHPCTVGGASPSSGQHQASSLVRNSESVKQEEKKEKEETIPTNRKPESSDSVEEAGGFSSPVQLMSPPLQLEKKSSEVEEIEQQKQPLHPVTPEQQTNATVANAVEKLFACLSPLRLKNRCRSSETKACENQSPGHEKNRSKDSLARRNSADDASLVSLSHHSSVLSHNHVAPVSSTAFVQEEEEEEDLNSLRCTGNLSQTPLTENDRVIAKSPSAVNVCHSSSSLPVHVESQKTLTRGQLMPMSALTPVSGAFLITVQSPSSGNGTLTEGNSVKASVFEKESSGNGHNGEHVFTPLPTTEALCRGSNEIKEIHKRKKLESEEEEDLSHCSKKKALGKKMASSNYHDDSEADAVKEDLQRAESTSQQKWSPSPVVPAVVGQFKRKLNETKAKVKGAKTCLSSSSLRSESVKNRFPGSCMMESASETEAVGRQLFCVCRTPYDSTRLYVGCDVCLDWFHASCVNLSRSKVLAIQSYVCEACQRHQSQRQELFCICREPYDESMFYIGCDECGGWFHGSCVGVSPADVGRMDGYRCRVCCLKRDCDGVVVKEKQWTGLKKLISMLKRNLLIKQSCKSSVVAKSYDGNSFVKEPFDLSSVEKKIDERVYLHLKDFVVDVLNIFNGCFDSNHRTSHIARNAIALEREFLDSFEQLKCCMCSDFTSSQLDS